MIAVATVFALAEVLVGVPLAGELFVGGTWGIGIGYGADKLRAASVERMERGRRGRTHRIQHDAGT